MKIIRLMALLLLSCLAQAQFITSIVSTPTSNSATIAWTTCAVSDSNINYGTTISYGQISYVNNSVTSHSNSLTSLTSGTLYHYNITSVDANGVQVQSADKTFTTSGSSPTITLQPSAATVCAGQVASFTSHASGAPTPTVQWKINTGSGYVNISGATSDTYSCTTGNTGCLDGYLYEAVFTNTGGSTTSTGVLLTVNAPPVVTKQPLPQSVVAPNTATFTVTASNVTTYQWQRATAASCATTCVWNNVIVGTGGTTNSYTTPATDISMSGDKFRVRMTNACSTITSNPKFLTVTSGTLYGLSVADASNRTTNVRALSNATLAAGEYVFTSPVGSTASNPTGITSVSFALDSTTVSSDATTPYDYKNVSGTVAAWDTTTLTNGVHSITQTVTKSGGGTEVDTATFTVTNNIAHSVSLTWTAGTAQFTPITYSVYRGTVNNGVKNRIATGITSLAYINNTSLVSGTTYYYDVTETDSHLVESVHSNQVTAVIP